MPKYLKVRIKVIVMGHVILMCFRRDVPDVHIEMVCTEMMVNGYVAR